MAQRCQELEAELAKLLEVNQEIYDRALEMEERVIQLEAKISDMEEEAEHLTMQLQNSWHLGYKKGVHDAEAEAAKAQQEKPVESTTPIKEHKPSIKSMIDFELPPEEKAVQAAVQESAAAAPLAEQPVAREPKKSIKSMIDFELPPEEKSAIEAKSHENSANNNHDEGRDTAENPPVFAENAVVSAETDGKTKEMTTPGYNDRVYNAAGDQPAGPVEAYGGMSWREVETIYQFSASNATGPSMVFEPMSPAHPSSGAVGQEVVENHNEGQSRSSRSDTQPIVVQPDQEPPILKADAAAPKTTGKATVTYTSLAAQKKTEPPEPPMELTMNQFLGETDSYLSLDRVTLEPPSETPPPPPPFSSSHDSVRPSQEETQTLQGAREQLEAMAKQASQNQSKSGSQGAAGDNPAPTNHPQASNPFEGRSPAQSFEDRIAAASNPAATHGAEIGNANEDSNSSSAPREAKWAKREASATYDGLNALDSDSTVDILDLEKLDIFEGLEDIDELSQIEVIEDVIIPGTTDGAAGQGFVEQPKFRISEHVPPVSSDDLHDLIKSRIKKAEEPHEPHRAEGFITGAHDKVNAKDAIARD
ncbi:MAG: hypothetical protein KGS72_28390, partial [Cyanobacteria bacterium REEB67]|nr:hypothetical protein [Cyanobacteria bacterium REEB67]